jgi:hypothetical protein
MPTINIFYDDNRDESKLHNVTAQLKQFVAQELTCGDIELNSDEVSVRLLKSHGKGMLAQVELEVTAASFKERVEKQDEICLNIQKFLLDELNLPDIKVWLILSELGHSWK